MTGGPSKVVVLQVVFLLLWWGGGPSAGPGKAWRGGWCAWWWFTLLEAFFGGRVRLILWPLPTDGWLPLPRVVSAVDCRRASGVMQGRLLEGWVDRLPINGTGVHRYGRAPLRLPFSWPSASLPLTIVRGGSVTGGSDGARGLPVGSKLVPLMVSGVSGCKAAALVAGAAGSWAELVARALTGLLSWPRGWHGVGLRQSQWWCGRHSHVGPYIGRG